MVAIRVTLVAGAKLAPNPVGIGKVEPRGVALRLAARRRAEAGIWDALWKSALPRFSARVVEPVMGWAVTYADGRRDTVPPAPPSLKRARPAALAA